MSRHSWKTSVAAKQMLTFSLHQMMDEDANVTIWLKGAVQMSGGDLLAACCPSHHAQGRVRPQVLEGG